MGWPSLRLPPTFDSVRSESTRAESIARAESVKRTDIFPYTGRPPIAGPVCILTISGLSFQSQEAEKKPDTRPADGPALDRIKGETPGKHWVGGTQRRRRPPQAKV